MLTTLLLALPGTASAAETAPCQPGVHLEGDAGLLTRLRPLLSARSLPESNEAGAGCGAVYVKVSALDPDGIGLALRDADGRSLEREVPDEDATVRLIESWSRPDMVAPLLASRSALGPMVLPPEAERRISPSAPVEAPPLPLEERYQIAAGLDGAVSEDGALWTGVSAKGCGRIGAWCLGGLARYARDTEGRGDGARLSSSRWALELFLMLDRQLTRGHVRLSPGFGLGQSSAFLRREVVGMEDDEQVVTPLLRAQCAAAFPLSHTFALELMLGANLAPFSQPEVGGDPETGEPPLAGVPRVQLSLGVAGRFGGP